MARFDVYKYKRAIPPLVVDVQADILSDIKSRVVIPLYPLQKAGSESQHRLKPVITIHGKNYVLMTTEISAMPLSAFEEIVDNIEKPHRQTITDALDFLFQGF